MTRYDRYESDGNPRSSPSQSQRHPVHSRTLLHFSFGFPPGHPIFQ